MHTQKKTHQNRASQQENKNKNLCWLFLNLSFLWISGLLFEQTSCNFKWHTMSPLIKDYPFSKTIFFWNLCLHFPHKQITGWGSPPVLRPLLLDFLVQFSPLTNWVIGGYMREDSAEILIQSFQQEAFVSTSGIGRDVHFLMLSIQYILCQPWRPQPSNVPWRMF